MLPHTLNKVSPESLKKYLQATPHDNISEYLPSLKVTLVNIV